MHKPLKKFGQNFLTQPAIARNIVKALQINNQDTIIEIGPGPGVLSEIIISQKPKNYFAIEIDKRWAHDLSTRFGNEIVILNVDFLEWDFTSIIEEKKNIKIIGNIPYNITSPILFKLLDHFSKLDCAVVMMQKEVAKRIVSEPGIKDFGILSILTQTFAQVEWLFEVGRKNFKPEPKVDSAVVKFNFFDRTDGIDNLKLFKQTVRGTFNYRRKMLRNSLGRIFDQTIVSSLDNYDLTRRPEQLTIAEFKELSNTINRMKKNME
ncbi:MAG: ribosomal RNA small subunit methyltransferase A [Calditrichaeota bacterium]|nr:MAG: ribosomal RNA small subunit methyltransferase A [Calditrichota bacterium]MBL1206034.1 ribosomal RNA small subunit methyltransferase A [Calditrichota bacterium]NOG45862.1 ribosomal RNA small subunit methyltransferase A [Calditrichota bacterium]